MERSNQRYVEDTHQQQQVCTVKPVYSGHLGEIDKVTTIYR
jgi:hypothetical protein